MATGWEVANAALDIGLNLLLEDFFCLADGNSL